MSHIFISYSRKDSKCVNAVAQSMRDNDFPIWIDLESLEITDTWLERIEQAINDSFLFVLFWSKNAADSKYVKHELNIAKPLQIEDKLKILVVMLDDTEIPTRHIQAYNMINNCTPIGIANFINELKPEWKQFSRLKTLGEQSSISIGNELVSVLYDRNDYCKAYIVGQPDAKLPAVPTDLAVCLQFARPVDENMIDTVYGALPAHAWILLITGPVTKDPRTGNSIYGLDNEDPAQWESCRQFIVKMIQSVGNQSKTAVHFYTLTPNALLGGVTIPFYRFWHIKLYNFVKGTYLPVLDIPRE